MKEEMEKDERFIIRTYEKAELAHLYTHRGGAGRTLKQASFR